MILLILFIAILSPSYSCAVKYANSCQLKDSVEAKIVVEKKEKVINITGMFYNFTNNAFFLYYELESKKVSDSGSSNSKQSGQFNSRANSESILSKIGLDIDESTSYEIILKVFEEEKIISSDTLSLISIH